MNFFNRAIKNVTRKPSKSILLALTFLLVGTLVIVGLGVSNAAESAKVLTRQKMRAVASMSVDYNAFYNYVESIEDEDERNKAYDNYPSIKLSEVQDVLKDSRVKTANALQTTQVYLTDNLTFVHLGNRAEENLEEETGETCYMDEDGSTTCTTYINPNAIVKANYFPNMIELEDGDYNIVEGRFYTQEEIDKSASVILVTQAFAETNGLKVGDRISFYLDSPSSVEADGYYGRAGVTLEDITCEYEIIGIYTHNQTITPDNQNYDYTYPYENPDNVFLMPGTTYNNASLPYQQKMFDYYATQEDAGDYYSDPSNRPSAENTSAINVYDVTILLNDPLEVDGFVEDYKDTLGEYKTISVDNEEFNKLAKPLDTLSLYANFIVWLVVINAVVIITLITALTLKTREYEIGVLLSMGATKFKVVAQFFVELAIVALLGFTLSIGTGSLIANKVGQQVLEYQIASSGLNEENENDYYYTYDSIWNTDYTSDVTLEDITANYNVSISPLIIGEIYVVGLGIVLISILIPSMMIMRFNPKKILMNQN